jgi:hypothetical protein
MLIKRLEKGIVFSISDRILWIFYLILFYSLDEKKDLSSLSSNDIKSIRLNIKKFSNLKYYKDLFNIINLDIFFYSNNYIFSSLYSSLIYYLWNLPNRFFIKNIYKFYYFNFKNFLNILNVYFIPNHVYKIISFFYLKKKTLRSFNLKFSLNICYKYKNYSFNESYYCFLKLLGYLNYKYIYNLNILINNYSFIVSNVFYNNYEKYYELKGINYFISSWNETNKRFLLNISSTILKDTGFYLQKKLITNYSSIKFTNALNLSKSYVLSFSTKIIMIQHLRRMLITSNIMSFFIFLKTYIKDFKFIYLNLKYPLNEIYVNPLNNDIICDIFINYNNNLNLVVYMNKYKGYIESLLNNKDIEIGLSIWDNFLNKFLNTLILIPNIYSSKNSLDLQKILIRYYLDCNVIFLINKKLFPLKKKKAQSISRRRYKKIVKFCKRRFWVF